MAALVSRYGLLTGVRLAAVVSAAPGCRTASTLKSTRASSVGQRRPFASTTSTSKKRHVGAVRLQTRPAPGGCGVS